MIFPYRTPFALAIVTLSVLSLPVTETRAQNWLSNDYESQGQGSRVHNDIGRNVYALDTLADQLAFRYSWELRFNRGCRDSIALLKHIRKHSVLTNDLVRAYRGKSDATFQKAVSAVRDSAICMQNMRKTARVSDGVSGMISESLSLTTFVHANSIHFQPLPVNRSGSFPAQVTRHRSG